MKRFFLWLLASILLSGTALAASDDLVGEWSGEYYGLGVDVTFTGDKTYTMSLSGDSGASSGTWVCVGSTVILDQNTDSELVLKLSGDTLASDNGAAEFTRVGGVAVTDDEVDARLAPGSRSHAITDYDGVWDASFAESSGVVVDCDENDLNLHAVIMSDVVMLTIPSMEIDNMVVNCSFSDAHTLDFREIGEGYDTKISFGFVQDEIFDGMVMMLSSNDAKVYFQMEKEAEPEPTVEPTPEPAEKIHYPTLERGSKGEEVVALQQRLIDLGYLESGADGDFGKKTQAAVEDFQIMADLPVTGAADSDTQNALYADSAAESAEYLPLRYRAMFDDPDTFEGKKFELSGLVVQTLEEPHSGGALVNLRVSTRGVNGDVVLVAYIRKSGETAVTGFEYVKVQGVYQGLITYESTSGDSVTVPYLEADSVTVQ